MDTRNVVQPRKRSYLRSLAGREYFILRRRFKWLQESANFAYPDQSEGIDHQIFRHKTVMLRPLRNVEMYLQHNKITNLRLAIAPINGVVIRPGQTFSLWRLVGRPTASRGFLDGLVLNNGRIEKGIAGGLCQLGNLLYWMALHLPLTVTERWRHGYDVFPDINRKIPFACGASLSYNYFDLQITNGTDAAFRIDLWQDEEYLNGAIFSDREPESKYEVFETDHLIKMQPWGKYTRHNRILQRVTNLVDGMTSESLVTENHAIMMYNPLLSD